MYIDWSQHKDLRQLKSYSDFTIGLNNINIWNEDIILGNFAALADFARDNCGIKDIEEFLVIARKIFELTEK